MRLGGSTKKNHVRLLARCCFPVTQLPLSTLCQQSQTTQDLQRTNKQTQGAPHPTPLFSPVTPHSLIPPHHTQTNKQTLLHRPSQQIALHCTLALATRPSPPDLRHPPSDLYQPTIVTPLVANSHSLSLSSTLRTDNRHARVRSRSIFGSDS